LRISKNASKKTIEGDLLDFLHPPAFPAQRIERTQRRVASVRLWLCFVCLLWPGLSFSEESTALASPKEVELSAEQPAKEENEKDEEKETSPEDSASSTLDPDFDDSIAVGNLADGELFSDIEEIQIQGQRGGMTEVDSADSSVVFSSEDLQALGVDDITDLAKVTPNLEIVSAGATSANFFIRGVGLADFSANAPSAVAIYQDGVPLNAPALQVAQIFDVGNVNVVRGPLGTGRGRNASAGVIRLEAKKPGNDFGATMLTRLFWFESPDVERSAMGQEYEGGIDIPIVEDWLTSRFSFLVREADPYIRNGCSDTTPKLSADGAWKVCNIGGGVGNAQYIPDGLPEWVGDRGNWGLRGQFRLQPESADTDWILNIHGGRLDQDSTLGQAIGAGASPSNGAKIGGSINGYWEPDQEAEFNNLMSVHKLDADDAYEVLGPILVQERPLDTGPYRGDYDRIGKTTLDTWGTSLSGDIFFDSFEVNTVTGYEGYDRFRDIDQDFTPLILFESITDDSGWQFSEDIKVSGEVLDSTLRWSFGGWFLMEQMSFNQDQLIASIASNEGIASFIRIWSQDTYGFAAWGEFAWDFLDDFTLEGGIRYNWEEKTFDYLRYAEVDGAQLGEGERSNRSNVWASPTGTLQLKYRFSDLMAVYWKYTHGFKTGYFNANEVAEPPIDSEKIDAIEVGFRGSWWDGLFSMTGDFFYYRYEDYQVFVFTDEVGQGPTLQVLNAPRAEVYGSEMQLTLMPLQDLLPEEFSGLRLQAEMGWLSSQFLEFSQEVRVATPEGGGYLKVVNYAGNKLPNTPDFTISATAEWEWDLGSWGALVPRYDLQWTTDVYFDPSDGRGGTNVYGVQYSPQDTVGQPGYALHNLQLLYRLPSGMAEVRIWGRNITDTRYKEYAFDATAFRSVIVNFVGEPRSVGFDLNFVF